MSIVALAFAARIYDGTTVAHICRRCDHAWVNEEWISHG